MRVFNKEEYSLFESIVSSTQEGILRSMGTLLGEYYGQDKVIYTREYIVAIGDTPIGIVAHMDTVHTTPVLDLLYDREKNLMWSPQGIGADDRAGVYGMIEILRRGHRPTLILTTDEECGALGASALVRDYPQPPCELNFLIELDRRGSNDCVFYDCDNEDFEMYIENYGFKTAWGSFSDISYICPAWKIAGVNLSIGYYSEHTDKEILNVSEMFDTLDRVCAIIDNVLPEDKFRYVPAADSFRNWYGGYDVGYSDIYGSYGTAKAHSYDDREVVCWGCVGVFARDEVISVSDNKDALYCGDCYAKNYTTCIVCKDDFEDRHKVHLKCPKCREEEIA